MPHFKRAAEFHTAGNTRYTPTLHTYAAQMCNLHQFKQNNQSPSQIINRRSCVVPSETSILCDAIRSSPKKRRIFCSMFAIQITLKNEDFSAYLRRNKTNIYVPQNLLLIEMQLTVRFYDMAVLCERVGTAGTWAAPHRSAHQSSARGGRQTTSPSASTKLDYKRFFAIVLCIPNLHC
jgi:hypothetical protein